MSIKTIMFHNLKSIPKPKDAVVFWNNNGAGFPKKIEIQNSINAFCNQTGIKSVWVSTKRCSPESAIREFKKLYQPLEFFAMTKRGTMYEEDSMQVFYIDASVGGIQ
ncbi:hypothetical protein [Methylomonas sp. AM2-LC]|uniref:hypothetical protein n=1 Tax=Methylomonas sp. AM2-LC TaxID=3153301 RepID=UPI003264C45A